jgi:uncharacterized membrane protein
MMLRKLAATALLVTGLTAASGQSHAAVEICNESDYHYAVSIGFFDGDSREWTSRGWYQFPVGKCRTVLDNLRGGNFYMTATYYLDPGEKTDDNTVNFLKGIFALGSIGRISGTYYFCTDDKPYTIKGDKRCKSRGYNRLGMAELDTKGGRSINIELFDNGKYSYYFKR